MAKWMGALWLAVVVVPVLVVLAAGFVGANAVHCDDPRWQGMAAACCAPVDNDSSSSCQAAAAAAASAQAACEAAAGSCQQTVEQTVSLGCPPVPACPDLVPACARWVRRYTRKGALRSQRCKRWAVVTAVAPAP